MAMQGFKPRDQREEESRQQQTANSRGNNGAQKNQKKQNLVNPRFLGNGGAAKAGLALSNRAQQIENAIGYANGGVIRGPGTGTSDDIEAKMPAGSYIMPADSTDQIGEEGLAGLGSPANVRVSNGEYQLPPEQVHAVGVQALDQMKNATHTPTAKGFNPQINRDGEQFFNQGGQVLDEEEAKRKAAKTPGLAPAGIGLTPEMANANRLAQQRQGGAQAINQTKENIGKKLDAAGAAVGTAADTLTRGVGSAVDYVGNTSFDNRLPRQDIRDDKSKKASEAQASQWAANNPGQVKAAGLGMQGIADRATKPLIASMSSQQPALPQQQSEVSKPVMQATDQPTPLMTSQPAAETNPETGAPIAQEQSGQQPAIEQSAAQQPVAGQNPVTSQNTELQTGQNNIIQDGNSFSANGPIRSGYTVNGQAQGGTNIIPGATGLNPNAQSAQNNQAKAALFDRTPEFGTGTASQQQAQGFNPGGGGPRVTVVGDNSRQDADYRKAFNAASTAHRGAQNGQLTAAQLRSMEGLTKNQYGTADANQSNATSRYNSDSTNSANILRTNMSEAGADRRASASNALDNRRLDQAERLSAPKIQAEEEKQSLYKRFTEAETDDQKSEILNQMRILDGSGGSQENLRNNFMQLGGGQEMVDGVLRNVPQRLIDLRTGQEVLGGQQEQKPDTKRFEKNKIYRDKSGTRFMWDGEKAVPVN